MGNQWFVDEETGYVCVDDARWTIICAMGGSIRNPDVMGDARLIAAAPEFLESLRLAKICIEAMIEYGRCGETFVGAALILDKINLAIAKAEGKQ